MKTFFFLRNGDILNRPLVRHKNITVIQPIYLLKGGNWVISFGQICSKLCADTALRAYTFQVVQMNSGLNNPLGSSGSSLPLQEVELLGEMHHQLYQMCASWSWGGVSLLFEQPGYISVFFKDTCTERKL